MNNTAYNVDYTRKLPEPLKNDITMLSLGKAIAEELQENIRIAKLAVIYPRIDELDETTLDILARDLHVDWYDDTYPVGAKRNVIKNSVRIHKRLGTKFAVTSAIGDIFPNSEVQEWFEYGGTHHRFRILLDLSNAQAPLNLSQIVKAAKFYKRLSAHLDEVVYQMSAAIEIRTETVFFRYATGRANDYLSGTRPRRNIKGGVSSPVVDVATETSNSGFESVYTGTNPYRAIVTSLNQTSIATRADTNVYKDESGMTGKYSTGETPYRQTGGAAANGQITATTNAEGYCFASEQSGKKPARNIKWNDFDDKVNVGTGVEAFVFETEQSGNNPRRNTEFSNVDNDINAQAEMENFPFSVEMTGESSAGTNPRTDIMSSIEKSGVVPSVTAESFAFKVKRCGTERCK